MKKLIVIVGATAVLSMAYAAEPDHSPVRYKPVRGQYAIYSGELGEQRAATKEDRKLSFIIEGKSAKEIFNAMPADDKHACSDEKGARSRRKETVWCTFDPESGYVCYFGFDLVTGKSIAGGIC